MVGDYYYHYSTSTHQSSANHSVFIVGIKHDLLESVIDFAVVGLRSPHGPQDGGFFPWRHSFAFHPFQRSPSPPWTCGRTAATDTESIPCDDEFTTTTTTNQTVECGKSGIHPGIQRLLVARPNRGQAVVDYQSTAVHPEVRHALE